MWTKWSVVNTFRMHCIDSYFSLRRYKGTGDTRNTQIKCRFQSRLSVSVIRNIEEKSKARSVENIPIKLMNCNRRGRWPTTNNKYRYFRLTYKTLSRNLFCSLSISAQHWHPLNNTSANQHVHINLDKLLSVQPRALTWRRSCSPERPYGGTSDTSVGTCFIGGTLGTLRSRIARTRKSWLTMWAWTQFKKKQSNCSIQWKRNINQVFNSNAHNISWL